MPTNKEIYYGKLNALADRINSKAGESGKQDLDEMYTLVGTLSKPTGTVSITQNGTVDVTQYASASVNVQGITPTGTKQITANGTYDVTEFASVTVNVPTPSPTLVTKSITANGTYSASSDNADGYSQVTVAIPTYDGTVVNS